MRWSTAARTTDGDLTAEEVAGLRATMERGLVRLINLVARDAGLQTLADAIADIFGCPAGIVDGNFSYLALSEGYSELWASTGDDQTQGYVPLRVQQQLRRSDIFHPTTPRPEPVFFDTDLPDGTVVRNYMTLIYLKHVPVASFGVFTRGEPIPQVALGYLPTIASLLSLEMQKSSFYLLNKSTFYGNLLARLLDPAAPIDDQTFRMRLAVFGYKLERYKQVVVVDMRDESPSAAGVQSFADQFRAQVPHSVYFIHNGDVAYLATAATPRILTGDDVRTWEKAVAGTGMRLGISGVFASVEEFPRALGEAKAAIDTGAALGVTARVFSFGRFRLADLIRRLPADIDLTSYVPPYLLGALDHDREHGSQLVLTLARYLADPANPKAVCEQLFIHKNTLYYRLNQLREIMGVDLADTEVRAQLHVGLLILRAQNRLDFPFDPTGRPLTK